ncbi:DUF742 domain-containing protein [Lentzea tibetensis]|uniref:DUF742 domain-containing protein n=1 Tax=Lentzea tibetensis TaxID=2591470 RepID=A0A563EVE1_9PSEU|nr:DUF742 domain-containing protein [Lentzea tibetensis]TWP51687.1 DUF742 domain-containing protein [Lentzea tibetensis]
MHDEDTEVGYVGARFGSPSVRKRLREERRRAKAKPEPEPAPPPEPEPEFEPEPVWPEYVDSSALVRPYARTGGRTESSYDLRLETLISAEEVNLYRATNDQLPMMRLCVHPRSVAEIAALSDVPLGVARVLLSDLITLGLVAVHERDLPDMSLLERVLAGLHRL